jgi:hypothetical protein
VSTFTGNWNEAGDKLPRIWAVPTMANPWPAAGGEPWASTDAFATVVISLFVWIVLGLMVSFLISFFFCSQTVIYFLLRKIVDATDMEEVYVEESEEEELPIGEKAETPAAGGEAEEEKPE